MWRMVKKDKSLKRVPNFWELVESRKLLVPTSISKSPRCRAMLKTLSEHRNLIKKDVLLNASQTVNRTMIRADGLVPTLTTSCGWLYAPYHGAFLIPAQRMALQGVDMPQTITSGFTDNQLYSMAGMAMSCPAIGCLVWAVISQLTPA